VIFKRKSLYLDLYVISLDVFDDATTTDVLINAV